MRPRSLTVSAFRSYAGTHTFDFTDRRLVGVVGPIGSGKSSLLDATAFALYGRTPTVGRDTRSLINQRAGACHVELWFEVEGEAWRAVRALRRNGQSEHALYRHAEPGEMSERLEVVTGERAVTDRVTELLGLGFPAFQRSVLLAQNQFAAFLRATPGDRDDVLRGVFGFEKVAAMQAIAKARADAAARDLAELERMRAEIEADRVALEAAREERTTVAARAGALEAALPAFEEAVRAVDEAVAALRVATEHSDELEALGHHLPATRPGELVDARAAEAAYQRAVGGLEAEAKAAAAAEGALAETVERDGSRAALTEAVTAARRLADRRQAAQNALEVSRNLAKAATAAARDHAGATAALEKAVAARTAAEDALRRAEAERVAADEAFHAAEHDDMAAALRGDLTAGAPCPVCEQIIATVPRRRRPARLATAEKARAAARKAETTARSKAESAAAAVSASEMEAAAAAARRAAAEQRSGDAEVQQASLQEELASAIAELTDLVGGPRPERRVAEWQQRLEAAETQVEVTRRGLTVARTEVDEARAAREEHRASLGELSIAVATAAARLGSDLEVVAEPDRLEAALAAVRKLWESRMDDVRKAASAATHDAATARTRESDLLAELGLPNGTPIGDAVADAAKTVAVLDERIAGLERRVARVAQLEEDNAAAVGRLETYRLLAADLAPSRFLKFLLDEERAALAELGSERLQLLTGRRYRFTPDGDFRVVDLFAADAVRAAESLSGGETFLASLALALALAEMVTREGGRLDAFFLDEGFGSLDAEHLDLAMDGIERLVSDDPDRLVVVVSHVPELRHRLEDLIELDRDPVTGDTAVRSA